jgi:hypothetical protein
MDFGYSFRGFLRPLYSMIVALEHYSFGARDNKKARTTGAHRFLPPCPRKFAAASIGSPPGC